MIKTSKQNFIAALGQFDLPKNHTYMVHSSMLRFGLFEGGLAGVVECLHEVLGPQATIAMPAFSFSYGDSRLWDYHKTKAETGALTEYFRRQPSSIRTIHPFHSISVTGPKAGEFAQCRGLSSFGVGSPFALLYDMEAINLSIGIGLVGGATFLHHAEETAMVPYRFHKDFPGEIIDENGKMLTDTYKMFVRKVEDTFEYKNEWDHILGDFVQDGLVEQGSLNGASLLAFRIKPSHDRFIERLKKDPFYCAKKVLK